MMQEKTQNAWLAAFLGFIIPGLGHCYQRRFGRGLVLGCCVLICFGLGLWLGGHLFSIEVKHEPLATLLRTPPFFANLGSGLPYIFCWAMNLGFVEDAKRATFEYGNTFLLVAGLLNYLIVLDAFDIATSRKS